MLRDLLLASALLAGLFALLEGGLRALGIGADRSTSSLAYQEVYPPAMVPARSAEGLEFWRTWDPRHPYQVLPREKTEGTLRVLCFGGSATAGLGHSPNVTFARQLEDLLAEAYPARTVEVVNLGVVAIAARQVRLLVEDALATLEPDLLLVWSGNNEFLPVHHAKFAARHATWRTVLREGLGSLNLTRALQRAVHGPPSPADVPDRDPDQDEAERLTQARIIRDITLTPEEFEATLDDYFSSLTGIVEAAKVAQVPLVLAGVAVNEEWRGREGLGEGWRAEYFGTPTTPEQAAAALEAELQDQGLSPYDRWYRLTRLATALDEAGRTDAATARWREALELDPHLRRATAAHLEVARRAAADQGPTVAFLDGPAHLRADDPRGRVGFRHLYDYVHFTPRGAMAVADGFYQAAQGLQGWPAPEAELAREPDGLPSVLARRLERIAAASRDFTRRDEFLGITFDPGRLTSTDLWKYDEALEELEQRLEQDPDDLQSLLYRACARSFRQDGQAGARQDWKKALELRPGEASAETSLRLLPPVPAPRP